MFSIGDRVVINAANTIWHNDQGVVVELLSNGQFLIKIGAYGEFIFSSWHLTIIS